MWKAHKIATEEGRILQVLWWWDWREHVGNTVIKHVDQRESGKKWRWVGKGEVGPDNAQCFRWLFFFLRFLNLFLAPLGFCCYARAFFSCSEYSCDVQASHCGVFSCCGGRALTCMDFSNCSTWAQYLGYMDLVAPWHVESSWIRNWACVHCIGSQSLKH